MNADFPAKKVWSKTGDKAHVHDHPFMHSFVARNHGGDKTAMEEMMRKAEQNGTNQPSVPADEIRGLMEKHLGTQEAQHAAPGGRHKRNDGIRLLDSDAGIEK